MRRQLGLGLLLVAAALAGCAEADPAPPPADPGGPVPSSSPSSSPGAETALTIVVEDGSTTTWRLTCSPAGGDHPDPAAACAALEQNADQALPPVDKDAMCTQVYGGDQTATITGTWRGGPVDGRFSLTDGCEIGRWRSLAGLLPPVDA
ncbi:hypothetical protein GCM10009616_06920 [Microlunatus lacustris]